MKAALDLLRVSRRPRRVEPGFYVFRNDWGTYIHIFKFGRRWYFSRNVGYCAPSAKHRLYAELPSGSKIGFPTYRMALSAAQGDYAK